MILIGIEDGQTSEKKYGAFSSFRYNIYVHLYMCKFLYV